MLKFDFVLNDQLYKKIEKMATNEKKRVSEIVQKIIIFMLSILQMKHLKGPRRERDYPFVNGKIRVRVSLLEEVYNQLKMIHDHLNTFSMAVLVRELLIEYFDGVEKYGEQGYKREVEKVEKRLKFMKTKHVSLVMYEKSEDIPADFDKQLFYLLKLDKNFCLKEFKFL